MKNLFLILCLCYCSLVFGQNSFPKIQTVETKDRIFVGTINQKYPITLYLKFHAYSDYHMGVYTVEGWYYYDKVKTKIPIVGIYDQDLTLYVLKNETLKKDLLILNTVKDNYWDNTDYYKNLEQFEEKFSISTSKKEWKNKDKTLSVEIYEDDFRISKTKEYLMFDEKHAFDFDNIGTWTWNFELYAQDGKTFILSFRHGSRLNVMGKCGAAEEAGFVRLVFDENRILQYSKEIYTESCNSSIETQSEVKLDANRTKYVLYDYHSDSKSTFIVDKAKLEIQEL